MMVTQLWWAGGLHLGPYLERGWSRLGASGIELRRRPQPGACVVCQIPSGGFPHGRCLPPKAANETMEKETLRKERP